jgi:hypothetical protein
MGGHASTYKTGRNRRQSAHAAEEFRDGCMLMGGMLNDSSSATLRTGREDFHHDTHAGSAAAHSRLGRARLVSHFFFHSQMKPTT